MFRVLIYGGQRKSRAYYQNWQTRQSDAYTLGTRQVIGDMSQVLGTFAALADYEQLILLSTTSSQASLDLLGVKDDGLDFIEFKKEGCRSGHVREKNKATG